MYLPLDSVIEDRLIRAFPEGELRELARATDLVQREGGKLDATALFFALCDFLREVLDRGPLDQ